MAVNPMKLEKVSAQVAAIVVFATLLSTAVGYSKDLSRTVSPASIECVRAGETVAEEGALEQALPSLHFRVDAAKSKFMVTAFAGGLLSFKGHDHYVRVQDFTGDAQFQPGAINRGSLQMRVRADSLVETRDVFTEQQKQIINKELREIVLETAKYPEITFNSTSVSAKTGANGQFDAQITGDLTLHGVTRHIVIPTRIQLEGESLRAIGQFTVKRSDYNVMATSAVHGLIRVKDKLKFNFDIVAHQG